PLRGRVPRGEASLTLDGQAARSRSMAASDPTTPNAETRKPIDARGVAWALTGVTVLVALAGVAVVRTVTPPPVPISEEIRQSAPTPPPIVLQPRRVDRPGDGAASANREPRAAEPVSPRVGSIESAPPRVAERPLPIADAPAR
ncbi:MAG: hypothetical protein AAF805_15365, partial [Planctomycetota bacterium]